MLAAWLDVAPAAGVGAGGAPAGGDEVVFGEDEVNSPAQVGEGAAELLRDLRLSGRTRGCLRGAQVVADVVVGEDLLCEGDVSLRPHFFVKALDQPPLRCSAMARRSYFRPALA